MFRFLVVLTLSLHVVSLAVADRGVIEGSVVCVRSGVPVSTHPVMLMQGRDTIARALTDRMGRFKLEFNYVPGTPLKIKAGASPTYLESPLAEVQADTEVTTGA